MNFSSYPQHQKPEESNEEISLAEIIAELWIGRRLLILMAVIALGIGLFYSWIATPIYSVDALLHVEQKKGGGAQALFSDLGSIFSDASPAQAEIEIFSSRMVLSRVVQELHLDIVAQPKLTPIIGRAMVRGTPDEPTLKADSLLVPERWSQFPTTIIADGAGGYRWQLSDEFGGELLGTGQKDELLEAEYQGEQFALRITSLIGEKGQQFSLQKRSLLSSVEQLRSNLMVMEKGKQTGMLGIQFTCTNSQRGSEILNEIIQQFVLQNRERKAEEASKVLKFLQDQSPVLREQLNQAEESLNRYRVRTGSVDLSQEAQLMLQQTVALEAQKLSMQQKKNEMLRLYKEDHDAVVTLNQQIDNIDKESKSIDYKVRTLPRTQQEVIRLTRDVQVNNTLYTQMLNNIQQLQMARAGEIGNARIIDFALPTLRPIKPKKMLIATLSVIVGLLAGVGLLMAKRSLLRRVDNPNVIENQLGLTVFVTIPHSNTEAEIRTIAGKKRTTELLALIQPEDLAIESLKSLRTTLHFGMVDAPNNIIMITSPSPGVGKTFVISNFATLMAQTGKRVLLVDADLRRGRLHQIFRKKRTDGGLTSILSGETPNWKDAVRATDIPNLDLLTTGTLLPNSSEMLMHPNFSDFTNDASAEYDYVLIDTAPILAITDAAIIGSKAGTTLLLVRSGIHPIEEIRQAQTRLLSNGVRLKGVIFNGLVSRGFIDKYYQRSFHYNYPKEYSKRAKDD